MSWKNTLSYGVAIAAGLVLAYNVQKGQQDTEVRDESMLYPELIHEGSPTVGRLFIIPQIHQSFRRDSYSALAFQQNLYNYLESFSRTNSLDGIFIEGLPRSTAEKLMDDRSELSQEIEEYFPEGMLNGFENNSVANLLARLGGARTYAAVHDIPLIYDLEDSELKKEFQYAVKFAEQGRVGSLSCEVADYTYEERERRAIQRVLTAFDHKQGQNIIMVYGAGHDFSDVIPESFQGEVFVFDIMSEELKALVSEQRALTKELIDNCY